MLRGAFFAALIILSGTAQAQTPQVERGRYLATMGDCVVCHTRVEAGSPKFAGGYPLHATPGTVYSSNITPDKGTGIGNWNADQFYRAMHEGIGADGRHLYPAFPYAYFTKLSRADTNAIFAYLKTVKPVSYRPPRNHLIFPADIRAGMMAWNALFLDKKPYQPDKSKSAAWNRGAQIVTGAGHCGACHSPKNFLFADKAGDNMQGNLVDGWFAPNLTNTKRDGLGDWTSHQIVQFLKTGRSAHGWAAGSMLPVIEDSTSRMTDGDRNAIATYLKSLSPAAAKPSHAPNAAQMQDGQAVFVARCSVCHTRTSAQGYPTLVGNTLVQSHNPDTVLRIILQGASTADTKNAGSGFSMPAFPVLSDKELADVATYIRNAWGNRAEPVSANDVKSLRKVLRSGE
ncbi:MAG TPA: cytochrome c [Rhizomicrobium sp.]|jgi:mono/diheme cytochrome c family protein